MAAADNYLAQLDPAELQAILPHLTPEERDELDKLLTQKSISERLNIPAPYPLQREIMESTAQFKVVCAGRRAGKTTMAAMLSIECLYAGKKALLSSASQDQSDAFWDKCKEWLGDDKQIHKNENRRIIRYGRGEIRVKTGSTPDALRGGDCDLLVLDECALLQEEVWYQVGMPMLADRNGGAVFISTPRRKNWFWQLFVKAKYDTTGAWAAWNYPTHQNPHLSSEYLRQMTADMHEEDYRQEILAEFLDSAGAVFRYVEERATVPPREAYSGRFIMGVDFGKTIDYTVCVVMDADRHEMVDLERFKGADWNIQRNRILALHQKWQCAHIVAETNSFGDPNVELLLKEGLPMRPFVTSPATKPALIESLVLAFDRDELRIQNIPVLKDELKSYERKTTLYGRSTYSAPPGGHDDCVMALALAWHGITLGAGVFFARL